MRKSPKQYTSTEKAIIRIVFTISFSTIFFLLFTFMKTIPLPQGIDGLGCAISITILIQWFSFTMNNNKMLPDFITKRISILNKVEESS